MRFEPRLCWLDRKRSEGGVSGAARRRIERSWAGEKIRKRKPSRDSFIEQHIIDAVGACPFVCSVTTGALASEAGRDKALTAARLALAAIALLWPQPSDALGGMNLLYDRDIHLRTPLAFGPGNTVLPGLMKSHMPYGPWLEDGGWETLFNHNSDYFGVVSEILSYVVDPARDGARPAMINTLAQALLWFHEGCRESVTLMEIVKFTAALDALACAGEARGIKGLITARLGAPDTTPIRPGGRTMAAAVDKMYGEGRSRTIHGTNPWLRHDWSDTRQVSEELASLCLRAWVVPHGVV